MQSNGSGNPADAADLDVDDAAGTQLQRGFGIPRTSNGLVEADGSLDGLLQPRVEIEGVVPQRLLDHKQLESVEGLQVRKVLERVGGVRIATQHDAGPAGANPFEHINVPPGFHLQLDALVSGSKFGSDLLQ